MGIALILNVVETIEKRGGEVIYQFPIAIDRDGNFYFDWTYGNDQGGTYRGTREF